MEENKELEQKKEHGFKSGVLTGVLGTVAVVLAARFSLRMEILR